MDQDNRAKLADKSLDAAKVEQRNVQDKSLQSDHFAPPAGPHSRPDLINHDATPGAGALPPLDQTDNDEVDAGTG